MTGADVIARAGVSSLSRQLLAALAICLIAGVSACAGRGLPAGPPPEEPVPGARLPYVIGVTDRLSIVVWKNPELSLGVPVRSDGKISVPLLDDVQAEGLTPEELKEVITQELSEFVSAPDVTVIVVEMNSRMVTMMGGLARSGQVPLRRQTRLLEAIATMGGFSALAQRNDVRILRRTDHGIVEYRFDYGDFLAGRAPGTNIVLRPGDHVVVPD